MKALNIAGLTTKEDVQWLADHAAGRRVIVEIGAYRGRSTRAMADAKGSGTVYAIDNWNATFTVDGHCDDTAKAAFYRNCGDLIAAGKVVAIEQDSTQGLPDQLAGLSVDMLWIDGDHSYEAVKSDIRNFAPLVRRGGLICGHDYSVWHPEVMKAVDEAYGSRVRSIDIHRSIWWVA